MVKQKKTKNARYAGIDAVDLFCGGGLTCGLRQAGIDVRMGGDFDGRASFTMGSFWDACSLVEKLIGRAKKSILLIDSWVGPGTLDMLAKKRKNVVVEVVSSPRGNKLAASDIDKFNVQYGGLAVRTNSAFHDRFLVVDDKELYLIGASLKDLGRKCFGFTKMDAGEIPRIKAAAFSRSSSVGR